MTPAQLLALGTAFAADLRLFAACFSQERTVEHRHAYWRGLLSDRPRQSIEPIALACGTAVRTLQEFLRDQVWHHRRLLDALHRRRAGLAALRAADDLGTIGVIDETASVKKGTQTPGVPRQYCGARGKLDHGLGTVHLGIVRGCCKTLIDAALVLPQAWSDDRQRWRKAGIPDDVVYRPTWRIALEQLDRAVGNGLLVKWLTFDAYDGSKPAFLADLDTRSGMHYVGESPRNFRCLATRPRGRKPAKGGTGKRADNLARCNSAWNRRAGHGVSLARLTLANQEWEVRAGPVYLVGRGDVSERTYWLRVARNAAPGAVKCFIANAPAATAVETWLRVAFRRWQVAHAFRVTKTEIGFSQCEGRS